MNKPNTFRISEIFVSLQGEGQFVGMPVVFVRFAGCDLECPFCDEGGMMGSNPRPDVMTGEEIAKKCRELTDSLYPNIVITGGEPTMQMRNVTATAELGAALMGCHIAMETNGHFPAPSWVDWVTWSPKDDFTHSRLKASEVKMLMDADGETYGELSVEDIMLFAANQDSECGVPPVLYMQALTYEDSAELSQRATDAAYKFVQENSGWRLGQRLHITMGLK